MLRAKSRGSDAGWATLLQEALVDGRDGRPPGQGWKSAEEFGSALSELNKRLSPSRTRDILRSLHLAGKLEMQRGKVGAYWIKFYRPARRP